ncbi:immediate early response 3-interacting protein 1-like [Corticium candelabrum]|uniref:immediate early response 3-interacting protein 1-like n=1 Tax=Corticium candelabrum TaxID=121492 RepID=UPI002E261A00|nr:immediate early response 3-interacting protein 1-like [Corticium candelabrum]
MAFTLGSLFEACLLIINAIAVLSQERFLAKIGFSPADASSTFGQETGVKQQIIHLISSVQTLLRIPLIPLNIATIAYEVILG